MALARRRDGKPLVEMLFRGHPKTADEWILLAMYLRGALKKRPGKAADRTVLRAAELYPQIKRVLPTAVAKTRRRLRPGQVRKAAIACTLAYLRDQGYALGGDTEQKVDNRLRQSRQPRKSKSRRK